MRVLGIDPGTRKVGLAVMEGDDPTPLVLEIAALRRAAARASELAARYEVDAVAVGGQTGASDVVEALRAVLPDLMPMHLVDERGSSYEARSLYWNLNPPTGLRRLIPRGMLLPPEPLDAYAAAVIACRLLRKF